MSFATIFRARNTCLALIACCAAVLSANPVQAERPQAPRLLPKQTLAYIRVADTVEMKERFSETSLGRILNDPQINPLVSQLYGEAASAFGQVEDRVGASLTELLALPQGELCVAVVQPPQLPITVVGIIDVGEQAKTANAILESGEAELIRAGAVPGSETVGETEVNFFRGQGGQQREVAYFQRDNVMVIGSNLEVVKYLASTWDAGVDDEGEPLETLADNQKFTTVMKHCTGEEGERPQISFFVDPIEIVKSVAQGNVAGQTALALLPALGLNGIKGVGGSITFSTEEFDSIAHLHMLMVNPRTGALKLLAVASGDITPEPWVPADAASYSTLHVDVDQFQEALTFVYDSIRGEGALSRDLGGVVSDRLGVDFEEEVRPQLAGRVTLATWMVKPARLNSQSNLLAIKLNDAEKFEKTLATITKTIAERFERKTFSGTTYYQIIGRQVDEDRDPLDNRPLLRRPEPAMAIMGDYLLISDSTEFMKEAILTKKGLRKPLADELDYKLIASKIRRQNGGDEPGMISFSRPEEGMRMLYELATADTTRDRLSELSENRFFGALNGALNDNPLPPFEVIQKYLAPTGGLLTNDETGLHYMSFSMKRQ